MLKKLTDSGSGEQPLANDKAIGAALVIGGIIGVLVYGYLLFGVNATVSLYVLEITAFVAVLAILAILGWIGYVMATTPPPAPLETEPQENAAVPNSTKPS